MFAQIVSSLARHALTAGGGYLVAQGAIDASQADLLIGAGVTIAGVVWSIIEKRLRLA